MPEIHVENLTFSYGAKKLQPVLKGINLTFEPGYFYAIIGPNGSGKTTLINLINSSLRPLSGAITIDGKDVRDFSQLELARNLSLVPQNTIIDFDFTVRDIVLMGRYPYLKRFQEESEKDIEIAEQAMKETGIFQLKDKYINQISGGERQRAVVARALAQQAPIMLLDEPISMLDIYYQYNLMGTIRRLMADKSKTVIAVLHDLNIAAHFADRIILMHEGNVYASGTPEEVYTPAILKNVYNISLSVMEDDNIGGIFIRPVLNNDALICNNK